MKKRSRLSTFERLAQRLLEGSVGRLLGSQVTTLELATRIHQALEDASASGRAVTGCRLTLSLEDYTRLGGDASALAASVTDHLQELLRQSRLDLPVLPVLTVFHDTALRVGEIDCSLDSSSARKDTTQLMDAVSVQGQAATELAGMDAFLILNGRRHLSLGKPVVNIGRRRDNDVVFEDPAVSRQHAQLRWRYGRFILYDLGSRAGTTVNGQRVQESVLVPGDVIRIGDATLIYGEGPTQHGGGAGPAPDRMDDRTRPMRLVPPDRREGE